MFSPEATRKFELIGVDLYTGIPVKDEKAKTISEAIYDHWVVKYGPPQVHIINKLTANVKGSIGQCLCVAI